MPTLETHLLTDAVLAALGTIAYPVTSVAAGQFIPVGDEVIPTRTPEQEADGRYVILYNTDGGTGGVLGMGGTFDSLEVSYLVASFGRSRKQAETLSGQVRAVFLDRGESGFTAPLAAAGVIDRRFVFRGGVTVEAERLYGARDGYVVVLAG